MQNQKSKIEYRKAKNSLLVTESYKEEIKNNNLAGSCGKP